MELHGIIWEDNIYIYTHNIPICFYMMAYFYTFVFNDIYIRIYIYIHVCINGNLILCFSH